MTAATSNDSRSLLTDRGVMTKGRSSLVVSIRDLIGPYSSTLAGVTLRAMSAPRDPPRRLGGLPRVDWTFMNTWPCFRENLASRAPYISSIKEGLGLSEDKTWTFCNLSQKCTDIPALKEAIDQGEIGTSNARRLLNILEPSNASYWLPLAKNLSQRDLQKEIVKKHPERSVVENIMPVSSTCSQLRVSITPETEKALSRCREVLSQKLKRPVSWDELVRALATGYLEKHDPVAKAERVLQKTPVSIRVNTPSLRALQRTSRKSSPQACVFWDRAGSKKKHVGGRGRLHRRDKTG